jgi:GMP synthase-like glutamine amidotransferase
VRVLAVVHQRDAGAGVFGEAVAAAGHELVEWMPAEQPPPEGGYGAALVFGGAMNVDEEDRHPWLRHEKELLRGLVDRGVPTLGVCLGAQLMAEAAGARPRRASEPEIGWRAVELTAEGADDPVVGGLPGSFLAFQWHSYEFPLPPGAVALARSPVCLQAFRTDSVWGIQFHAEVSRPGVGEWLDGYRKDPDAVRIGIDPVAIRDETDIRIDSWNEAGRALCSRFLDAATRA